MARKKKNTLEEKTAILSKMLNSIKGSEKRHSLVVLFPKGKKPLFILYTLILGKAEGKRRGWRRMRWLDSINRVNGHEFEQTPGKTENRGAWHVAIHGVTQRQI